MPVGSYGPLPVEVWLIKKAPPIWRGFLTILNPTVKQQPSF